MKIEHEASTARESAIAPPIGDVIDVLGGFCRLERRSKTLGGSIPLRAAQACVPLLEGNAWGFQIVLGRRLDVRRKLGRFHASFEGADTIGRLHRAALPIAHAAGILDPRSEWSRLLEDGVVGTRGVDRRALLRTSSFSLFTGLFVRPHPGVRLRASSTKNRRSLSFDVGEAIIDDPAGWVPLVLEIQPRSDAFTLVGEVATLGVLSNQTDFRRLTFAEGRDVAEAHVRFYDREYFEAKKSGDVARKYRHTIADRPVADEAPSRSRCDVIDAGRGEDVVPAAPAMFHRPAGPTVDTNAPADRLVVKNVVGLEVTFDGLDVRVAPDPSDLRTFAERVRASWGTFYDGLTDHPGALLYLTKYVTPHPAGEPHFFVKPAALLRTAPGVSTLLEGGAGDGFEVMRGVVETDSFHATPAVFQLTQPGARVVIPRGTTLLELFAWPRAFAASEFSFDRLGLASPTAGDLGALS